MALSRLVPDAMMAQSPGWLMPLSIALYLPFAFFAYTLFGNLYAYILATIASVTAVVTALVKGRPSKLLRVWLLLVTCAITAFPLFFRYQPALVAGPGYRMQLVTNPGFLGGIIKASQNLVDNLLYYRATCGAEAQIWRYSPTQRGSHTQVSSSPASLSVSTIPKDAVLGMVRSGGVRPEAYESVTRPILLESRGVVSPDGRWTAVVTQHVYGTQDVIILTDAK